MVGKSKLLLLLIAAFLATVACFGEAAFVASNKRVECATSLKGLHNTPVGFKVVGRSPADKNVKLTIAVKQTNLDKLEKKFWEVSDPKHKNYGKHMTLDDIASLIAPTQQSLDTVIAWLNSHGITNYQMSKTKDFITCTVSVLTAETLLQTEIYDFHHAQTGKVVSKAANTITVPENVKPHIDFVGGLSRFPNFKSKISPFFKHSADSKLDIPVAEPAPVTDDAANAPVIIAGLAGNNQLRVVVRPLCSNGSVLTTLDNGLCDIQGFNLVLQPQNMNPLNFRLTDANSYSCYINANDNNYVNCILIVDAQLNYVKTNVSVSTVFTTGSSPSVATNYPAYMGQWTTPQVLSDYYGFNYMQATSGKSTQAVAEFLDQYYAPDDLNAFFTAHGLPQTKVAKVIGFNNDSVAAAGGEASLDIEYIMAVGQNISTQFWSTPGGSGVQEPYLDWLNQMSSMDNDDVALVHSISYGDVEADWSADEANRVNVEFQKAGLRGITLIFSSGDDGVGNVNAATNLTASCNPFNPAFPATSPYVTSVGATQFSTFANPVCASLAAGRASSLRFDCNDVKEIACSADTGGVITTGGGFSNLFSIPSYQADFVENYLALNGTTAISSMPPNAVFNRSGRAFPDVAAMGHNFVVVVAGETIPIHGTSASAPVFAGMIALLNDIRLKNGKAPFGFLNPWLYQVAREYGREAFYDVTVGNNKCAAQYFPNAPLCCQYGFEAAPGWDPVTGLGSPKFEVLRRIVEKDTSPYVSYLAYWVAVGVGSAFILILATMMVGTMSVVLLKHKKNNFFPSSTSATSASSPAADERQPLIVNSNRE